MIFFLAILITKIEILSQTDHIKLLVNSGRLGSFELCQKGMDTGGSFNAALKISKALKFRICISLSTYLVTSRIISPNVWTWLLDLTPQRIPNLSPNRKPHETSANHRRQNHILFHVPLSHASSFRYRHRLTASSGTNVFGVCGLGHLHRLNTRQFWNSTLHKVSFWLQGLWFLRCWCSFSYLVDCTLHVD